MALCTGCHKGINPSDAKRAVVVKDEKGRLKGVYHLRCDHLRKRKEQLEKEGRTSVPSYDQVPAAKTADSETSEAKERQRLAQERYDELMQSINSGLVAGEIVKAREELALANRQVEIEESRAQEAVPERWSDWRGADTTEV